MGWGSIGGAISKAAGQVSKAVETAGSQARDNSVRAATLPLQVTAQTVGAGISAVAPVLGQATQVLQQNPALGNIAGGFFGVPGLGSMFGGGQSAAGGGGGYVIPGQASGGSMPSWIWAVLAGVVVLVVVLLRRK